LDHPDIAHTYADGKENTSPEESCQTNNETRQFDPLNPSDFNRHEPAVVAALDRLIECRKQQVQFNETQEQMDEKARKRADPQAIKRRLDAAKRISAGVFWQHGYSEINPDILAVMEKKQESRLQKQKEDEEKRAAKARKMLSKVRAVYRKDEKDWKVNDYRTVVSHLKVATDTFKCHGVKLQGLKEIYGQIKNRRVDIADEENTNESNLSNGVNGIEG